MSWLVLPILFLGCGTQDFTPPKQSDTAGDDDDDDDDDDTDTDVFTGTDADGDGFTVEEGDCDDNSVWVNPGWDEDTTDDIDNDCDGRIDESWAGLAFVDVDKDAAASALLKQVDTFGDLDSTITIQQNLQPFQMADDVDGTGWVVLDTANLWVATLEPTGGVGVVVNWGTYDFSQEDEGEPFWISGIASHPDGYYVVGAFDRLWRVDLDGDWEVLATWPADLEGGPFKLALTDLTVDPLTGTVHLFGAVGGYGTWSESEGVDILKKGDLEFPEHQWIGGTWCDGDHAYALGTDELGVTGVFRWKNGWKLVGEWTDTSYSPDAIVCEGETGDFYISTHGGWQQGVWRMLADGSYLSDLYLTAPVAEERRFRTLAVLWEQD